jgi:hypothetical protein
MRGIFLENVHDLVNKRNQRIIEDRQRLQGEQIWLYALCRFTSIGGPPISKTTKIFQGLV